MEHTKLTNKERRVVRRWFRKIDDDTIELKEKGYGFVKITFLIILYIGIYFDAMKPESRQRNIRDLQFAFMPETRFQKNWRWARDLDNPGFSITGESKAEYMKEMWEMHKGAVWEGYRLVAFYLFLIMMILWPTNKRRFLFDRKRGIIYTYAKGQLYVTEINKLVRPLHEYFDIRDILKITIWVHPYIKTAKYFSDDSRMNFHDYSIWIPCMMQRPDIGPLEPLQRFLIDYMNPDVPPERYAAMMKAVTEWRSPLDWLMFFFIGFLDVGLFCKPLPRKAFLQKKLDHYFAEIAPTIQQHPSWRRKNHSDDPKEFFNVKTVSDEENKQAGYTVVPCPQLFEHLDQSEIHKRWAELISKAFVRPPK